MYSSTHEQVRPMVYGRKKTKKRKHESSTELTKALNIDVKIWHDYFTPFSALSPLYIIYKAIKLVKIQSPAWRLTTLPQFVGPCR